MAKVKAVIYRRQSLDRTGEELGITRQLEDGLALANRREWEVVGDFPDNDISGSGAKRRPEFEKMLTAIEAGQAQAIIAWDLTRLTRNARDTLRILEVGKKHGVTLAMVRGSDMDLSTAAGQLTAGILAQVAQHEIALKSERQKRAAEQLVSSGLPGAGRRPFGYEPDRATIREIEANALRLVFDAILAGVSLAAAAKTLNEAGLCTPQKTRAGEVSWWTGQTLGTALRNPRYAGLRARTIRPPRGRPTWEITGKASWEGIVAEETWRAVVGMLDADDRRSSPGARALLTGVALCGVCGADAGATIHQGRTADGARTYRCSELPGHLARQADVVDEFIAELVIARLSRDDAASLLQTQQRPDTAELRTEEMALRKRLDMIAVEFADGELSSSQLRTINARMKQRLSEIETALQDAGRVNVLGPLVLADDVRAAWEDLDTDRQRAIVDVLISVVLLSVGRGTRTFRPETIQIEWRTD